MPVSSVDAQNLNKEILALYIAAEEHLLKIIAKRLAQGIDEPGWADAQLANIHLLIREVDRLIETLDKQGLAAWQQMISYAFNRGTALAGTDLEAIRASAGAFNSVDRGAIAAAADGGRSIIRALGDTVRAAAPRMFREVIQRVSGLTTVGVATRRQSAVQAMQIFAARGITGFQDSSGRNWDLASYTEMATRTAAAHAAVTGHVLRLKEVGQDLVSVSVAPESCDVCNDFEGRVLSLTGATPNGRQERNGTTFTVVATLEQAVRRGFMHPNCFPGSVLVTSPHGIEAADSRWYEGEIVVIHTACGNELPVTPNHPILTTKGWVAAGLLTEGDSVLSYNERVNNDAVPGPNNEQIPAKISDVFDALRESSEMTTVRVPASAEQFHGDGLSSEVEVVFSNRLLRNGSNTEGEHSPTNGEFLGGRVGAAALLTDSAPSQVGLCAFHASYGVVGSSGQGLSFGGGHVGESALHRLASGDPEPEVAETLADGDLADSEGGRDLLLSLAGLVSEDKIVKVERDSFHGFVYNLESETGWYVASSIVVHNCRHRISTFLPGFSEPPAHPEHDAELYKIRQGERARERIVREHAKRVAVAEELAGKDSELAKEARAKKRAADARLREYREEHDRFQGRGRTSLRAR